MANTILHKRSAVALQTPNTAGLVLGELAINTFEGKLYLKKDDGSETIIEVGATAGLGDLTVISTAPSDILQSTKDLFRLTASSSVGFEIENIPDFGFDTPSVVYTTNNSTFNPPISANDMYSAYIRADGLAVYIIDSSVLPGTIYEFVLGSAFDVTTIAGTPNSSYVMQLADHSDANQGIWFNKIGTKAITSSSTEWAEYNFSVPFDLTTASFVQAVATTGDPTNASPLSFSQDGTKAFRTRKAFSTANWFVSEYNVGTPYDVSTISLVLDTFEVTTETAGNDPRGAVVNNDGTKIFIVSDNSATLAGSSILSEYTMITPYSSATMSLANQIVITEGTNMRYLFWSEFGTNLYMMDNAKTIFQYSSSALTIGGITSTLKHNGNNRLATSSTGVTVGGSIAFTGATAQVALPNYKTVSLPATTITGGLVYDTDTGTIKVYDGAAWVAYNPADPTTLKSADIGVTVQAFAATTALTSDITYEQLDINGDVGTTVGTLAIGNHDHTGVYEPADATILKDADIGVTVTAQELTINSQTGTTYTLAASDNGDLVSMLNIAAITLTIPLNASVPFPIGTQILVEQEGAGQITIAPEGATILNSAGGLLNTASQFSTVTLIKKAIDTWTVAGDLA